MEFIEYIRSLRSEFNLLKYNSKSPVSLSIVLGNESSDLDSFVSTLSWSYYKALRGHGPAMRFRKWFWKSRIYFPISCIKREIFQLRGDCRLICNEYDVNLDNIIFIDELESILETLISRNCIIRLKIILVDQPTLPVTFKYWLIGKRDKITFKVVEIIDHHRVDRSVYEFTSKKLYQKSIVYGSNCTNISEEYCKLLQSSPYLLQNIKIFFPTELIVMLLSTILLDTSNLDIRSGRVTKHDSDIAFWLIGLMINNGQDSFDRCHFKGLKRISINSLSESNQIEIYRESIYNRVYQAKQIALDNVILSSRTILLLDFKIYEIIVNLCVDNRDSVHLYGISTVWKSIYHVDNSVSNLGEVIKQHCECHKLDFHVILTYYIEDETNRREMVLFLPIKMITSPSLNGVSKFLGNKVIETARLEPIDNYFQVFNTHVIVGFSILDMNCSRKKIQPLLHERFQKDILS
jgi:inorganic pyrophosphatase/exopolyphosphatase